MSRARTADEIRDEFLAEAKRLVRYWAREARVQTIEERVSGAVFSLLCMIDGVSGAVPCAFDLVARPHPDDKAVLQREGRDWIENGTVVNDCMLHEAFYREERERQRRRRVAEPNERFALGCPACGNLVACVCALRREHASDCRFRRAAELSVELACDHGYQACPTCDPCTCGVGATEGIR